MKIFNQSSAFQRYRQCTVTLCLDFEVPGQWYFITSWYCFFRSRTVPLESVLLAIKL